MPLWRAAAVDDPGLDFTDEIVRTVLAEVLDQYEAALGASHVIDDGLRRVTQVRARLLADQFVPWRIGLVDRVRAWIQARGEG